MSLSTPQLTPPVTGRPVTPSGGCPELHRKPRTSTPAWTDSFSLPTDPAPDALFDTIVSAYDSGVATWLLNQHGPRIDAASDGLTRDIRQGLDTPLPARAGWDHAFGRAHLALKEGQVDPLDAAVRIGLCLLHAGRAASWTARLPATTLLIGELAVEGVVAVDAQGAHNGCATVRLHRSGQLPIECRREAPQSAWSFTSPTAPDRAYALQHVGHGRHVLLLTRSALPLQQPGGEVFQACDPVVSLTPDMLRSLHAGFDALQRNAPQYLPWVERVLKGLVVCPLQAQFRQVSGSWEDVPGYVHVSSPHPGIDVAEIMVHESAHQYFYMLQQVGPVDDASDTTLYWSPPIRRHRPLSRILMAYHALANVMLLYDGVRRQPHPDVEDSFYVRANLPDLRAAVQALDEPLRDNPALTALGRGLYQPLADRLDTLDTLDH